MPAGTSSRCIYKPSQCETIIVRYALFENHKDVLLLIARVLLALLFVLSDWSKLTDFTGTIAYMLTKGAPLPTAAAAIAVVMELLAGIAVAVGFYYPAACAPAHRVYAC